jgi:DNA topoisomerase-1
MFGPQETNKLKMIMAKNLVIVESPAKAKTIEGYLGKDFVVKSSFGHVRDLPKKNISIDIEDSFKPDYIVPTDKKKIVQELKKLSDKAETVWLATDEDREGEAISWHLSEALKLPAEKTKRIVFHEITKTAILTAIEHPRPIDINVVNAQQARRVLDRLVGYELSPILWRKVKPSLSAGRVQSVAVRIIVEREKEIREFNSVLSFRVLADFETLNAENFSAEYARKLTDWDEANELLQKGAGCIFKVFNVESKPAKKSPVAPFTTSTLQQEASRKLGYSVAQTMMLAQKLYESGNITYMRTDSVNLSEHAIEQAKRMIISNYGEQYSKPRRFTTKSKGAQEAHEAIRPVDMNLQNISFDDQKAVRLYNLIWKRTVASQMADAKLERTTIKIEGDKYEHLFIARGEVLKFDGFLKVYLEGKDDEDDDAKGRLPLVKAADELKANKITTVERFSKNPPRYNEATLVRKLEELGIGRPSTYAPTISTIQKRGYVEKKSTPGVKQGYRIGVLENGELNWETKTEITGAEKNKLFPTDIGIVVNDFLVKYFDRILSYNFTADIEEKFDEIAEGNVIWSDMIGSFYKPFHSDIEHTLENSEKATGQRDLGTDPESGKPVIARIGRFGPMIQIGETSDEEKPKFASLRNGQTIQDITLEEAMELFKFPRKLGMHEGIEVLASIGRFGPYVKVGKTFVSIADDSEYTVETIKLEDALKLYNDKVEQDKKRIIKSFNEDDDLQVLNGKYGPYIKQGRKNFRIPKDVVPNDLSFDDCIKIIKESPAKKSRRKK